MEWSTPKDEGYLRHLVFADLHETRFQAELGSMPPATRPLLFEEETGSNFLVVTDFNVDDHLLGGWVCGERRIAQCGSLHQNGNQSRGLISDWWTFKLIDLDC
jgi:hypothetical protein